MSEKQKERIEKGRKEKAEDRKSTRLTPVTMPHLDEATKKAFVKADSASGLIEKSVRLIGGTSKNQRQKHKEAALIAAFRKEENYVNRDYEQLQQCL